ncbi:MAG: 2-polyprenyl-3-methyl-5-hydroxy-6-metoxy-1,4-benzoquinol methylase [Luteibaculaceae bacterium]
MADADNLEEQTEQFDGIICSEVLEHLKDLGALVQSFSPWIKPGGTLIAPVPNGQSPREVLVTKQVPLIQKHLLSN